MIRETEALFDNGIHIDEPVFARAFARVQQHVLDDTISSFAVLHNLVEIAPQSLRQFVDLGTCLVIEYNAFQSLLQVINQFARNGREIIY